MRDRKMKDSKDDFHCPLCGCRLFWFPVSHIFLCESCEQSFNERAEAYLRHQTKSPVGNAAAMREALEAINRIDTRGLKRLLVELVESDIFDGGLINKTISAVEKARRTLSTPARNCDRFMSIDQARTAYCSECGRIVSIWDGNESRLFEEWLLAPAAERKEERDE